MYTMSGYYCDYLLLLINSPTYSRNCQIGIYEVPPYVRFVQVHTTCITSVWIAYKITHSHTPFAHRMLCRSIHILQSAWLVSDSQPPLSSHCHIINAWSSSSPNTSLNLTSDARYFSVFVVSSAGLLSRRPAKLWKSAHEKKHDNTLK